MENRSFDTSMAIAVLSNLLNELFGVSYISVLDYYAERVSEKSFLNLLFSDPIMAYYVLHMIYKVDVTIQIIIEALVTKVYRDLTRSEIMTDNLMSAFKKRDVEKARTIILEVADYWNLNRRL